MISEPILHAHGVLLHIGVRKTGTTALQGALHQARDALRGFGVVYPGTERQHWRAAVAVTGAKRPPGAPKQSIRAWNRLTAEVAAAGDQRVIVSSEYFQDADDETVQRIIDELGRERVQVAVTLRPLAKILPSAWQQYVRNQLRMDYDSWLVAMLDKAPYEQPTPSFWQRHRHDELIQRWAEAVGPDNVTVVIANEQDPGSLLHTFESMADLPGGVLEPEEGWTNRSLSYGEIEMVRALNIRFREADWSRKIHRRFVAATAVGHLQAAVSEPSPSELRITTPRWALARAGEIGAVAAAKIEASGVRVIGDLGSLASSDGPSRPDGEPMPEPVMSSAAVGEVVAGLLMRVGAVPQDTDQTVAEAAIEDRVVSAVAGRDLVRIAWRRLTRRFD